MPTRKSAKYPARRGRSAAFAIVLLCAACPGLAAAQAAKKQAPKVPPPNPDSVIATVGPLRIARAEFDSRYARQRDEYAARSGSELAPEFVPIAKRQVLEGLIQRELLKLEAQRRGLLATEAEAEAEMMRDPFFRDGGSFNQAKFDAIKTVAAHAVRERDPADPRAARRAAAAGAARTGVRAR
jgi:hypothetical protein